METACVAPWVSIEFDPSGWVYACCTSGLYPLGRIGTDRLRDLWGGPRAQVMREALEAWDLTVGCGPCRWHLEHGRMDPVAAVYDQYPVSSPDPEHPHMMLFALSNRCNLGCVMCTPELSTTLRHEAGLEPLASPYDDEFFADLEPLLRDLKLVKFLGGEPFLAPEHKRVWELFDRLENPPRMQVTTNGSIWNDYVQWLLDRFEMDISISIDANTASTYEMIRRGGDHARLLENLDRFEEACSRRGTELHVSYCLLNSNVGELADFLAWADRFEVPSSVNLVTDEGLALHDEPLEVLLAVQEAWDVDEARVGGAFGKNRMVWDTQRRQLASVIEERRAGTVPAPRQAQPVPDDLFVVRPSTRRAAGFGARRAARRHAEGLVVDHVGRLERWSGGGAVGRISIAPDGRITSVDAPHERLGIGPELVGQPMGAVVRAVERALRRAAWVVEVDESAECAVRTLVVSAQQPVRGARGVIVRTIEVPTPDGAVLLAAEDRIYDDRPDEAPDPIDAVPVSIGPRPSP